MKCPVDGATLNLSERGGIEIDYCPECRGVWLDRGELDKIVERVVESERGAAPAAPAAPTPPPAPAAPAAAAPPPPPGYAPPTAPQGFPPQPGYGQPAYGQPAYGQPAYGQHGFAPPHKQKRKKHWLEELLD